MKYFRLFFIFVLLFFPSSALDATVTEHILDNGLKVIIIEEHKAPVATFQVWYRAGSTNEPLGKSGLSHLLEHMMFKGTERYGPSELSMIIQRNGGTDNAYTTKDYTAYFELMPSDKIFLPIALEADRMQNLTLKDREVVAERSVVMEERRLRYEDDPQNALYEEVVATAYKTHPYQRPVIGWMSDLQSIEKEDLQQYYKQYYAPNNAFIIVVGDVTSDEILKKIRETYGDLEAAPAPKHHRFDEPEQKGERRIYLRREAELPYLFMAYHVPSFPHKDSFALDVLALILSGGKSTRLYQTLVYEKQMALGASASYHGFYKDPFLFFASATAAPGKDIQDVEALLNHEIERIKKEIPSEYEVQKAKNQIEASFIFDQDSIFMQAMKYGIFEMLGGWKNINTYLEGIRNVTPQDVTDIAGKYLGAENRTVGILIPKTEEQGQ